MNFHITVASTSRETLFPHESLLRAAVHRLVHTAGPTLVLFCIVDDHLHFVLHCDRPRAGLLTRSIKMALRPHLRTKLAPAHISVVEGRAHLERLASYLVTNPKKHGLQAPSLWSGSCFLDFAGARDLPGFDTNLLSRLLPRHRVRTMFAALGLPPKPLEPSGLDKVRGFGASALANAAGAVLAVPDQSRRTPLNLEARTATVHLGTRAGIPSGELAFALGVHPNTTRRLVTRPDLGMEQTIRRHLTLNELARSS